MKLNIVASSFAVVAMSAVAVADDMGKTQDNRQWKTFSMPEYGLHFQYPPEAKVDNSQLLLAGTTTIDGLHRLPLAVKLKPEYSAYSLTGVFYNLVIQIIMLTDAAQLNPFYAKRHGWTERPRTDFYPFDFKQDERGLCLAIEELYLMYPEDWMEHVPTSIGGKSAILLGFRRPKGLPKKDQSDEEIIAVPLQQGRILLLHAGYRYTKSASELEKRKDIFQRIARSVVFDGDAKN